MAFYTFRAESVLLPYVNNPIAIFPFYLLIKECQDNIRLKTFLQQHLLVLEASVHIDSEGNNGKVRFLLIATFVAAG